MGSGSAEDSAGSDKSERQTDAAAPAGDARHRDKFLMLAATLVRLGANLGLFVVLARFLGPDQFGLFGKAIAYTVFVTLLGDYGFALSAMRQASAHPDQATRHVREAIVAKSLLTAIAMAVGTILLFTVVEAHERPVFALSMIAALGASFAEILFVLARVHRRYDIEASIVIGTNIVAFALVAVVAFLTRDLYLTAIALAVSRLIQVLASWIGVRHWLRPLGDSRISAANIRAKLDGSGSYAADSVLTATSGQIDILAFSLVLSTYDLGIYQGGSRLVQAILPVAMVLSSVYLPPLAATLTAGDARAFRRNARRLNFEFLALAVLAGLGFALTGPLVTDLFYGQEFSPLQPLWIGFAAFASIRLMAASFAIQLAARAQMLPRIVAQALPIALIGSAAALWGGDLSLGTAVAVLALANVPLLLVLGISAWRYDRRNLSGPFAMAVILTLTGWALWLDGMEILVT